MTRAAIACLLIAAACQKKQPPAPCGDLRAVVDRMYDVELRQVEGGLTPAEKRRALAVGAQVSGPMKDALVGACTQDEWPAAVVHCMTAARGESAIDECESALTVAQRKRIDASMAEIVARITPPDEEPADDDETDVGIGESGIPACDDYARAMQRFVDCEDVSDSAKDAARAGLAQLRKSWPLLQDKATPASAKQASAEACVQARAALAAGAAAMRCDLAEKTAAVPAGSVDCTGLGAMVDGLLAEQLRDVPAEAKDHAKALATHLADPMKKALIDLCATDRWSPDATRCLVAARSGSALAACEAKLTAAQAQRLGASMQDVTTHLAGSGGDERACDAYLTEVNALLACDKLPAADKARLQRTTAMVVNGLKRLADPSLPAAARTSLADTCTQAQGAAHALAQQLGCR